MTRFGFTRESFIPAGALKIADKKSDAVAYLKAGVNAKGKAYTHVVAFCGKRAKPDINTLFGNEAWMREQIKNFFEGRQRAASYKAERKAAEKAPRKLEVGTVLVGSFGYDQTNVVAYQVTELVGAHSVRIRPVATTSVGQTSSMSGYCIPCPDQFTDEKTSLHRVTDGNRVRIASYLSLRPWNGTKLYESSYA